VKPASLTVPARTEFIRTASQFVLQAARHLGAPVAANPMFEVAIAEAVTNAVKHGSRGRENASVTCEVDGKGGALRIRILDEGDGFTPDPHAAPVDPSALDIVDIPESGYGLPIIRTVFKGVHTCRNEGRFCLELTLD
jgi:anti-sigma regulatory factor (Ser/Thr protein kinase)